MPVGDVNQGCGLCGAAPAIDVWRVGRRTVRRCAVCGMMWSAPMPSDEELNRVYGATYFEKPDGRQDRDAPVGYVDYRASRFLRQWGQRGIALRLRELLQAPAREASPTLLDVGCASGQFMDVAHDYGFVVEGVERDPRAVAELRAKYRFPVACADFAAFSGGPYDAVAMLDVIEHLRDPFAALRHAASLVRPGGLLALATVDAGSWVARLLGSRNELVRRAAVGEHLWFFTRDTLTAALDRAGFEAVRVDSQATTMELGTVATRLGLAWPALGAVVRMTVRALRLSRVTVPVDHRLNMIAYAVRRRLHGTTPVRPPVRRTPGRG